MNKLNDLDQKWRIENGLEPLTLEDLKAAKDDASLYPSVWFNTPSTKKASSGVNFIKSQIEYHGSENN